MGTSKLTRSIQTEDPHFRIGQLEGAIMGAIQHLESVQNALNKPQSWLVPQAARDNEQVIANLKQLIGVKE